MHCIYEETKTTFWPWIVWKQSTLSQFKHLGNTVSNQGDFIRQDTNIKRAIFVNKNIELNQEFHFANPKTKFNINQIYNSHFTGSPLWNLFSAESLRFESSYNRSVKIMFDLPYATHCHLIEPITEAKHLRTILVSRFLGFIEQIRKLDKIMPRLMLREAFNKKTFFLWNLPPPPSGYGKNCLRHLIYDIWFQKTFKIIKVIQFTKCHWFSMKTSLFYLVSLWSSISYVPH